MWPGQLDLRGKGAQVPQVSVVRNKVANGCAQPQDLVQAGAETRPRKPKTNKVHDCLRKVWDTLPDEACVQLREAGFEAKPARTEDVDLVALLQQHVGDLPQVIVDALPATPTPDPRQEGKEAGDVLRSSVGKLRDLGQRKLRLQEEIDTAKDNLRAMLHKMQDIQNAIEEAKVEVAKTTKEYEDKVVKHCAEEVNNGVESVLQALGMQEASLTEEQKRKLEALKSDEAKRRRMQVDPGLPPGLPPSQASTMPDLAARGRSRTPPGGPAGGQAPGQASQTG